MMINDWGTAIIIDTGDNQHEFKGVFTNRRDLADALATLVGKNEAKTVDGAPFRKNWTKEGNAELGKKFSNVQLIEININRIVAIPA